MMKKLLIGTAVAMACASASVANAAATIMFDQTGSGGAGMAVDAFDWLPGNAIVLGAYSNTPNADGTVTTEVVAQGRLGNFVLGGSPTGVTAGAEFTFQARFYEIATGIGSATAGFSLAPGMASVFNIYYDPTADSNEITGAGFGGGGDAQLILSGTLVDLFGSFTDQTILNPRNYPVGLLDQLNADDQNGTLSHAGSGSTTIEVDVAPGGYDANFFRSNISSLMVDLQDTSFNALPFSGNDPSDQVFGETPFYSLNASGDRENGLPTNAFGCQDEFGNAGSRCDLHLSSDGRTSFNPVAIPEPGSLALLGLGMGGLGMLRRRKAKRAS